MRQASIFLLLAFLAFSGFLMAFSHDDGRRDEYQQQTEARLKAMEQKLETLKGKASGLSQEAKANFEKEMGAFKEKEKTAAVKLQHLKAATAKNWERGKAGVDAAIQDLTKEYEKLEARYKNP